MEYKPQSIVHQVIRLERKIVRIVKRTSSTKKVKEDDQAVKDPSCIFQIVEEVIQILEEDSSIQDITAVRSTTNTDIIHY
jgi:hypothetical protein